MPDSPTPPASIPFASVIFNDSRDEREYGDITSLAASMRRTGSINPISLSQRLPATPEEEARKCPLGYVYDVVAGRRRYKAMVKRGVDTLYYASTFDPDRLGFLMGENLSLEVRKETELDENLQRLNPSWIKQCELIYEVHEMKKKRSAAKAEKWGESHTADLMGPGFGKAKINNALKLAELIKARDPEIMKCKTMTDAINVRLRRAEEKALAELQRRLTPKVAATPSKPADVSSLLSPLNVNINTKGGDSNAGPKHLSGLAMPVADVPRALVPLSQMFTNADTLTCDWPVVNHIITDIPYGIDMDNLDAMQVASVKDTHDVEQNVSMMQEFLQRAFIALRPGGFCVFCYDLDHHEKLQAWALAAGFRVQGWPVIIHKTSACQNNAAQYNTTKNFECIMYLRKDETSVLRRVVNSSVRSYDFYTDRKLYSNPFAKPFALWKDIFDDVAFVGQSILDPFCGEMSCPRAAVQCGLIPYGIEISEKHYTAGLAHMRNAYNVIHKNHVDFQ